MSRARQLHPAQREADRRLTGPDRAAALNLLTPRVWVRRRHGAAIPTPNTDRRASFADLTAAVPLPDGTTAHLHRVPAL